MNEEFEKLTPPKVLEIAKNLTSDEMGLLEESIKTSCPEVEKIRTVDVGGFLNSDHPDASEIRHLFLSGNMDEAVVAAVKAIEKQKMALKRN